MTCSLLVVPREFVPVPCSYFVRCSYERELTRELRDAPVWRKSEMLVVIGIGR